DSSRNSPRSDSLDRFRHDGFRLVDDALQVRLVAEAFRVDLVDVLRAGRTGREPAVLRDDLEAADVGAVSWRLRQLRRDLLPSERAGADCFGGELLQRGLLRRSRGRI